MKIFFVFFILLLYNFCKPADPNFREKPLLNTEYTGFISRNFFQAVVEIPLTKDELTILEERKSCLKDAIRKRDELILPMLKQIAMEDKWNERTREKEIEKISDAEKEKLNEKEFKNSLSNKQPGSDGLESLDGIKKSKDSDSKNPLINRGEFSWFLDSMFLYKEDYSEPEKCSFVFRNIQENLFAKVEKTKLTFVGEDKSDTRKTNSDSTNPNANPTTGTNNSTSPMNTGLPQTIR